MATPDAKLIFAIYYIAHTFALGGQNYGMLSFYAMGGFYTIIFDWFLCRFMATSKEKLIFAIY